MYSLLRILAAIVCLGATLLAGCGTLRPPRALSPGIIFPCQRVANIDRAGFNEPSGICWHSQRKTLFVVGDEGDVCEIKTDGTLIKQKRIRRADFEGITHDPSTGLLYIAVEGAESIIELNPETFEISREFALPRTLGGKTLLKPGGQGIEAITFIPDAANPEGGTFCVANQAFSLTDEQDISAIFVAELPLRSKTGRPKLISYFTPGVIDLSGLHYDPVSDHIFVISDECNVILEYSRSHRLLKSFAFPGDNQEGITVDDAEFMYVTQDSGGIIKLKWLRGR
jgi:uncharacterized protein YjiK